MLGRMKGVAVISRLVRTISAQLAASGTGPRQHDLDADASGVDVQTVVALALAGDSASRHRRTRVEDTSGSEGTLMVSARSLRVLPVVRMAGIATEPVAQHRPAR